ncbi:cation/multidrug efflux system, mebrane-fusion component AcrA [Cupriavidus necator N-1]|uniref:Cation/multidrug efflux system, mebrane-fusion component AcrA n=1 Tax=Cupriavidus necator (strain ATCC 43291 / DSM 13513 / CCUG 52238 / LMG 8453 / N-1) TaxID=1042878 RepID=G0ETS7_CUPNN|nr:efflux RND transporter periplasmic adaptor subunit [Cupriavidus necator]AEI78126.1 cation/multidrug efflux system, mebrane-fusion component AcrA [Cupriavidus necator N-1]MDX6013345.1 efflux RND transporter periplasmic adaptor subunit [Cupriavidus necator]
MKRKTLLITAACIAIALTATVAVRKAGSARQPQAPAQAAVNVVEFLQTDLVSVARQDLRVSLPLSGGLRALNQASVKAKVSGEVKAVLVREGEPVRTGQVIVRIDPTEYEAKVAQARGQMLATRGQFENSRQTWERNRELVGKGFISRTAFDKYQADLDVARANLDAAQGGLAVAQKALADTVVKAPLEGMVAARAVQPGEKVSPDTRLVDVVDLRVLELEAPIPMADVARAAVGQPVALDVEGAGRFTGKLVRINPAVSQGTRSIMVYIRVENADQTLRAGMFARGALVLGERAGVAAVPSSAVRTEGERAFVYAIDKDTLAERPVQLGIRDEASGMVEIVSGLDAGTEIVRNNLGTLRSGSQVKRVKA